MINCKFIYRFKTGGASDSLNQNYKVHSVPRVGDTICFIGDSGSGAKSEVKEVVHNISTAEDTHEIVVYYGDK